MRRIIPAVVAALGLALTMGVTVTGATTATAQTTPILTAIRAAHHPGFDRLVFEFQGGLPAHRSASYVPQVVADPSGKSLLIVGNGKLLVRFSAATGHNEAGMVTYGATKRTFNMPNLIQYKTAGDFEAVLSFGVGVARVAPFHMFTLTSPDRVVIDLKTFPTADVRVFLLNKNRFAVGQEPYTQAVNRHVLPPRLSYGALQRLFAGPTLAERAQALRFVSSKATGFKILSISDGVARVQLTGGCSSGGSTFTIADEIFPTLKQFPWIHWVKIYGPSGFTEHPTGHTDSIPFCLEP
jgi:hypothetical protein